MDARQKLKEAGMFNKELAALCGQSTSKNLRRRQKDWENMSQQNKIGDGHRDITGYKKPGSLKK